MRLSAAVSIALLLASPFSVARAQPSVDVVDLGAGELLFRVAPDPALFGPGPNTLSVELAFETRGATVESTELLDTTVLTDLIPETTTVTIAARATDALATADPFDFVRVALEEADPGPPGDIDSLGGPMSTLDEFQVLYGGVVVQNGDRFPFTVFAGPGDPFAFHPQDTDGDVDVDDFGVFVNSYFFSPFEFYPRVRYGDFNLDLDVDLDDFGVFVNSFQNAFSTIVTSAGDAGGPVHVADFDLDRDVDVDDFGVFVNGFQSLCGIVACEQDLDQDGDVDLDDFGVFVDGFQRFTPGTAIPGDFDRDGDVDHDDFGVFVDQFQIGDTGGPPYSVADFDQDGDVDTDDFGVFASFDPPWPPTAVPEPGPLALFVTGAFAAAARPMRP